MLNKNLAICTIASKNGLAYVRALYESAHQYHSDIAFYFLLVDKADGFFDPSREPFQIVEFSQLDNIIHADIFSFKHNISELKMSVKPYFLDYLFRKFEIDKLIYLDPDILVFDSFDSIWQLLDRDQIILTPYVTEPIQDGKRPDETDFVEAGIYNLGFIALRNTEENSRFLVWWQEKLCNAQSLDNGQGLMIGHHCKWMALVPGFFDAVKILRDPRYNVACWNLQSRVSGLIFKDEKLMLHRQPVIFYNFSGVDPDRLELISNDQNRFVLSQMPNLKPLFERYRDLLMSHQYQETKNWPYAFGCYSNGSSISDLDRRKLMELGQSALRYGNPFTVDGEHSFFGEHHREKKVSRVFDDLSFTNKIFQVFQSRADLQKAYPDPFGKDRLVFMSWIVNHGLSEYKDDRFFQENVRAYLHRHPFYSRSLSWLRMSNLIIASGIKMAQSARLFFGSIIKMVKLTRKKHATGDPNGNKPQPICVSSDLPSPGALVSATRLPFGVNVSGYIRGVFGISEATRASISALKTTDVPLLLNHISGGFHRHRDFTFTENSNTNPYWVNLIHVNCDGAESFRQMMGEKYFKDHYNIGVWFWELSKFPERWLPWYRYYDEIWVATSFCRESIGANSPIPVVQMDFPIVMDSTKVSKDRSLLNLSENLFVFLFSFDFSSFFERKNPLALVTAFIKAFPPDHDDVALVIKSINSHIYPDKMTELTCAAQDQRIRWINEHLSSNQMKNLMNSCDCYISLHRSEGFGLGMAEAMFLKKPVIATGYSGNMDFMNEENSFLVRYRLVELKENYGPYEKGNVWADPDIDHAAELMRFVHENREQAGKKAERAGKDIRHYLNLNNAGKKMETRLRQIAGR